MTAPAGESEVTGRARTSKYLDTGTETLCARTVDAVAVLTFNRPHRRNALHPDMYEAIPRLLDRFAVDDEIGCVLITGTGSAFCAGGDVRDGTQASRPDVADVPERAAALARSARMVRLIHDLPKPTIAALSGAAAGAGMSIALSADLRIAARSARLIPAWGRLAFSGDFGGAWFLTRLVGPAKAFELLVDGRAIDADEALGLHLFNKVVDDGQLPSAALAWATKIAGGPTTAWAAVKANIDDAQCLSLQEALPRESERMVRCGLTMEHRRAARDWLRAAAQRRSPTDS